MPTYPLPRIRMQAYVSNIGGTKDVESERVELGEMHRGGPGGRHTSRWRKTDMSQAQESNIACSCPKVRSEHSSSNVILRAIPPTRTQIQRQRSKGHNSPRAVLRRVCGRVAEHGGQRKRGARSWRTKLSLLVGAPLLLDPRFKAVHQFVRTCVACHDMVALRHGE